MLPHLFSDVEQPSPVVKTEVKLKRLSEAISSMETAYSTREQALNNKTRTEAQITKDRIDLEKRRCQIEKKRQKYQTEAAKQKVRTQKSLCKKRSREEDARITSSKKTKTKSTPRDAWLVLSEVVAQRLFQVPKNLKNRWTGVVTTDGITSSWHCQRPEDTTRPRPGKHKDDTSSRPRPTQCTQLQPKHYGAHGRDTVFNGLGVFNVVAVDPGHAHLISAVREHRTNDSKIHVQTPRKSKLETVYAARNRSIYKLSNREWANNCGRLLNRSRHLRLSRNLGLQVSIDRLASASSRSGFSEHYTRHAEARTATAAPFQTLMGTNAPRRWKLESYRKEQRAVEKLRTDLLGGLSSTNTLIVWGNGGFGPTSRGHDAAPNKKLQHALALKIPLVTSSEFRSTQTSCCHHCPVDGLKTRDQQTRSVVVQCRACKTLLGRDLNAASVILDIFEEPGPNLPLWIRDESVREANSHL